MFDSWEKNFDKWKKDNENNPDMVGFPLWINVLNSTELDFSNLPAYNPCYIGLRR